MTCRCRIVSFATVIERRGDLWAENVEGWRPGVDPPPWIVVTTNGETKSGCLAIMGAGVAKDAARLWPVLPSILGKKLRETGNRVYYLGVHRIPSDLECGAFVGDPDDKAACLRPDEHSGEHALGPAEDLVRGVVSFPTKHRWREMSSTHLIDKSAEELVRLVESCRNPPSVVVLPRVGTGLGGLATCSLTHRL